MRVLWIALRLGKPGIEIGDDLRHPLHPIELVPITRIELPNLGRVGRTSSTQERGQIPEIVLGEKGKPGVLLYGERQNRGGFARFGPWPGGLSRQSTRTILPLFPLESPVTGALTFRGN